MLLLALGAGVAARAAPAADAPAIDAAMLAPLAGSDTDARLDTISQLGMRADPGAARILEALSAGTLYVGPQEQLLIQTSPGQAIDAVNGQAMTMPAQADTVMVNNRLRRAVQSALAGSRLFADDWRVRLTAANNLSRSNDLAQLSLIERALQVEQRDEVRRALEVAQANLALQSPQPDARRAAAEALGKTRNPAFRTALANLSQPASDGTFAESDERVREAAARAVAAIDRHQQTVAWAGHLFYGLSLGSVLLLAALGLAITFGLMGVINMAHGELLMIGAYVTYVTQVLFRQWLPGWMDWYVLAALPAAFFITAMVGMVLERTVIRWLYGRPLETLLATWGISLILMQGVRTLFGAQNVEVSNPSWMSGGVTVLGGLVLTYNRMAIIVFAVLVVAFVWLLLNHTRLGLFVRAITQNRRMADCVGVPTGRVDMLAFGLGAGIAGLAGVALSQLGNVGPDLGRAYIVDSFMVVVLGGVGQLAGTVIAAFSLGTINKFIEPYSGAVLAKIMILVLIVLVVQKRPQGLFAPRGRSVE
ncbi:MAG: urea ABC transporter permease subunit UrtB [Burkholderiaceae bacterium]